MAKKQQIRIKLCSYDHVLVDRSCEKIVNALIATNAAVIGPIPLPTKKKIFTVNRSVHVNKKSREQFEYRSHHRLIDTFAVGNQTIETLVKIELPYGVDVKLNIVE